MAGIAMITIEASIVAIVMDNVVLDSAIHLYRPSELARAGEFSYGPVTTSLRTFAQFTPNKLLDGNYLLMLTFGAANGYESRTTWARWRNQDDGAGML
jgi:hypothetical protein